MLRICRNESLKYVWMKYEYDIRILLAERALRVISGGNKVDGLPSVPSFCNRKLHFKIIFLVLVSKVDDIARVRGLKK